MSDCFVINDVEVEGIAIGVTTRYSIIDPEYNMIENLVVYTREDEFAIEGGQRKNLYIQSINPADGKFTGEAVKIDTVMSASKFNNGAEWGNCINERNYVDTYIYYARKGPTAHPLDKIVRRKVTSTGTYQMIGGVLSVTGDLGFELGEEELARMAPGFNCGPVIPAFNNPPLFENPLVLYLKGEVVVDDTRTLEEILEASELRAFDDLGKPATLAEREDHLSPKLDQVIGNLTYLGGMASFPIRIIPQSRAYIWTITNDDSSITVQCCNLDGSIDPLVLPGPLGTYPADELVSVGAILTNNGADGGNVTYVCYAMVNRGTDEHSVKGEVDIWQVEILPDGNPRMVDSDIVRPEFGATIKHLVDDESFVDSEGNPYLSTVVGIVKDDNPYNAEVWVISLSGTPFSGQPALKISESSTTCKKDPEAVKLNDGFYVYYLEGSKPESRAGLPAQLKLKKAKTGIM